MQAIGVLPDQRFSHIDHLVPLCQMMGIPILVTDPWAKFLIELYYPPMEIILAQPEDYCLDPYIKDYDVLFYTDFFRLPHGAFRFAEHVARSNARSVFAFHGVPDKFEEVYWLERPADEDIVLFHGPRVCELMRSKGVMKEPIVTGNYRLEFYLEHKPFFDAKLPFEKQRPVALYAPTWASPNQRAELRLYHSTFFEECEAVFAKYPKDYQLVVKMHPYHLQLMTNEIDAVRQEHPEIYFLDDFPPIYPLMNATDLYVGDYSSVGYDFLYFDRPMHLLMDKPTFLKRNLERPRAEVYREVYGERKPLSQLREEICASIS